MPKSLLEKSSEHKLSFINIRRGTAKRDGTCNFHDGDIDSNGNFIDYIVMVVQGTGIQVRICRNCFDNLKKISDLLW